MNIPAIIAMIVLIIGFASGLIYPIFKLRKISKQTIEYKKVKGEVVDFIEKFHYFRFVRLFYPIIKYTIDNREYKIVSEVGYSLSLFMPKKLTVLYNPQNPYEAKVTNERNLMITVIIGFSISIILMLIFLFNDLIFDNTAKIYEYRVICNYEGFLYDEKEARMAKSKNEALSLIKEKYKNWSMTCEFEEINTNAD